MYIELMVDIKCFPSSPQKVYNLPPTAGFQSRANPESRKNEIKINMVKSKKGNQNQKRKGTMAIYIIRSASSFPFASSSAYGKWSRIEKKMEQK